MNIQKNVENVKWNKSKIHTDRAKGEPKKKKEAYVKQLVTRVCGSRQ